MSSGPNAEARSTIPIGGGLAVAAAIVAFGFIGSRLLGVLRTVAIADAFGTEPELDAWRVAFQIPDLIFQVLAGATMGSAFIPVFARLYRNESAERAWRLASSVLTLVTAATALLCALAFIFAPLIVPLLAPGLGQDIGQEDELVDKAVLLTRVMLLSPLLFAVSGMVTGILNARQHFFLPALAPMLYNVAIILGAVVLSRVWGIEGLAIGVVAGAALHLLVQIPGLIRAGMRYQALFDLKDAATREVGRLMAPRIVGLAAMQLNLFVTIFFASKIGSGAIANMTYAFTIAQLPLALFAMSLSTAVFPRLANQVADGDLEGLRDSVSRVLRLIMFFTVPAAIGLALLREPVTVLLLQGGAFTSADAAVTAAALGWYCLGIVPQAGVEIHSRGFYAMGDTRTPVILTVVAVVANAAVSALVWERYGTQGLAFSVSLAAWIEWSLLWTLYQRKTGRAAGADFAVITKITFAAAVMAVCVALASVVFTSDARPSAAVTTAALAAAGVLVYATAGLYLRLDEVREAMARVQSMLRRQNGPPEGIAPG
jgi:putative peptidoglycan lipid II flippase